MTLSTATKVERAAHTARHAIADRDNLIRQMHDEHHSLRQIAAAADLSHGGVAKIIARTNPNNGRNPK